jgi:hypothetical protein
MKLKTQTSLKISIKALMNSKENSKELVEMPMRASQLVKTSLESLNKVVQNSKLASNIINKTLKIPLLVLEVDS